MEFLVLTCWSCAATFYTASERSTHHLLAHERLTRAEGTPLVPPLVLPMEPALNGLLLILKSLTQGGEA